MSKEKWTSPEVEEFDITERTQFEGGPIGDLVDFRGGFAGGEGDPDGGGSGTGAPAS